MKAWIVSLILLLVLVSGCNIPDIVESEEQATSIQDEKDTMAEEQEEPQQDGTLGLSTQEELFEVIRNAVADHLKG
jgi:ABC-type Fe3+-citrate transport system substrate-binding protein